MARSSHSAKVPRGPMWRIWDLNPGLISLSFGATKCPLGEGWERQHFIKRDPPVLLTFLYCFCFLSLWRLLCPPPFRTQASQLLTGGRHPGLTHPLLSVLPSWGPSQMSKGRGRAVRGPHSSQSCFLQEPGPQLSPGVRSITPLDQACSAGGSSGRLLLGAGSPSQPYLI